MDVPRKSAGKKKLIKRIVYGTVGVIALTGITIYVSQLKPADRKVDAATVWSDTVKRGSMLRQVRGLGTLVPEEIRWIPAVTQGRVEKINYRSGAQVSPDTVILELSNDELQRDLIDAETQLRAGQAEYVALKVRLDNELLNQRAAAATVKADYKQAKLQAEVNEDLSKQGLLSTLQSTLSKVRAEELAERNKIEEERLAIFEQSVKAQLDVQQARVDQQKASYTLRQNQISSLQVRAGMSGSLQQVTVEVGQQVTPGQNLARVSDPTKLKAELRIAETQAKDIQLGQPVTVDTRNGIMTGRVIRIDLAPQNGTVAVDASLESEYPKGARPDLSVDGTIELERLENILYVGRPVQGQENGTIGLFKYDPDGQGAARVQVRLGRSSVNTIEIVDGLKEGDKVILSDTSQWDNADRIRLN
jgi:HlyD family secretion protein